MTTIYDVAKLSRVSAKTVSRVINRERGVSDSTRQRVLRVIEDLDFRPSMHARGLGGRHAYTIGLAYDNPNAYYIIGMQQGALRACGESHFGLQMYPCDSTTHDLGEELYDFARRGRLSGWILTTPVSERPNVLRSLAKHQFPFVRVISAMDCPLDGIPCAYVNDRSSAHAVTTHLLKLGHTRIAFLKGGSQHHASAERLQGYKDALKEFGVQARREWMVDGDYIFEDGFLGARQLLGQSPAPTAIFCCNDEIAAGALAGAQSLGLQVPYDVSIAGFEDSRFSQHSWPPITTARQRADTIVEHVTNMLINRISGEKVGSSEAFSPELVIRGSTAPPPATSKSESSRARRRPSPS